MDAKTRRILIIVCVAAFLLTSAFTWGVISAGIDLAQHVDELGGGRENWPVGTIAWMLSYANVSVPVFFLVGIIWLVMKKPISED